MTGWTLTAFCGEETGMSEYREILAIHVRLTAIEEVRGCYETIRMILFEGEACGPDFQGRILAGGVDTQREQKGQPPFLSARYMLEGVDGQKQPARLFIENAGSPPCFVPHIITDSPTLAGWETADLTSVIEEEEGGILIRIRMKN